MPAINASPGDRVPRPGPGDRGRARKNRSSSRLLVASGATMRYMSQPLSLRLPEETVVRLGAHASRRRLAPRTLAQRYVEEGLRMEDHPLIRFVDGVAGRRVRLVGTSMDVWEVIAVVRGNGGDINAG